MAINYQFDVINPFQAALQGYGAGAQILQQERNAALQQQQTAQQSQLFALQMEEARARAAEAQRKIREAEQQNQVLGELYDALGSNEPVSDQLIARVYPVAENLAKFAEASRERRTSEQKANDYKNVMNLLTPFMMNMPELGKANIERQLEAARNADDTDAATVLQGYLDQLEKPEGDQFVKTSLFVSAMGMEPKLFNEQFGSIKGALMLPGELAELDANLEAAKQANSGVIPAADVMKAETDLRKEYTAAAKGYNETRAFYSQLLGAANEKSSAGDTALITLFRKVLDPTSVVRESEFAQTAEGGGLLQRVEASAAGLLSGQKLTDAQRKDIVNTAKQFVDAANAYERSRRSNFDYIINRQGLDPKAIYGLQPVGEVYQPGAVSNVPDYINMSMDQLRAVNTFGLTMDQARAYNEALLYKIQQMKGAK